MSTQAIQSISFYEAALPGESWKTRVVHAFGFSLIIGLVSQLEIHLPFTPVPVTAQTFAILTAGALLGRRWGALSVALYLAEGSFGLPFFAGGAWGALRMMGPTGGYLLGFVPAAWLVGMLAERGWGRSAAKTVLMMASGDAVIFAAGMAWLARFVPLWSVAAFGLYPFLLGEAAKIALAAGVLPSVWKPRTRR